MAEKSLLNIYANHFYNLGLNVTSISNEINEHNFLDTNLYKAPCHNWKHLQEARQEKAEFEKLNWDKSIGIGTVLGYNNLMAVDIDGCIDINLIYFICDIIGVDKSYAWITQSGSGCGFHILFQCDDIDINREYIDYEMQTELPWDQRMYDFGYPEVNSYYPKRNRSKFWHDFKKEGQFYENHFKDTSLTFQYLFQRIEFMWKGHLVLPESLHACGLKYKFVNGVPKKSPEKISIVQLKKIKKLLCGLNADDSRQPDEVREFHSTGDGQMPENSNEKTIIKYLVFDTETNGLPKNPKADYRTPNNWPRLLQLSWLIVDQHLNVIRRENHLIKPVDFLIHSSSALIHGITKEKTDLVGCDLKLTIEKFLKDVVKCQKIVAHNYAFDSNVLLAEMLRVGLNIKLFQDRPYLCTMESSTGFCDIDNAGELKYPSLNELYYKLFNKDLFSMHNAGYDALVTKMCYDQLEIKAYNDLIYIYYTMVGAKEQV